MENALYDFYSFFVKYYKTLSLAKSLRFVLWYFATRE